MHQILEVLRKVVEDLEKQKAFLDKFVIQARDLYETLANAPPELLANSFRGWTVEGPSERASPVQEQSHSMTHFERLCHVLRQDKNSPKTIVQLCRATGLTRSAVSAVVYRTHRPAFCAYPIAGKDVKFKAWALRDPNMKTGQDWERHRDRLLQEYCQSDESNEPQDALETNEPVDDGT